ncbi:MAG: WecB/TagA/CpsF family glycosyltransferase [Candidatus Microgenomates bacterium]|jgi:N-acetylglucosaminyldiphosphoundecaprenol N-acetyl-beta-D-mannosaminyltransferase
MKNSVLGVKISGDNKEGVLRRVRDLVARRRKFSLFSINPEIVLLAGQDQRFKNILNRGDINIPDGSGLKLALPGLTILKGRMIFAELCRLANRLGWKIFLLGGPETVGAGKALQANFKKLKIESCQGPKLDINGAPVSQVEVKAEKDVVDKINKFAPEILFVGFGAPKQEKWIAGWLPKLNVGGAMAVGGSFDYLSGKMPKSPAGGPEWLWRLVHQPRRFRRIFNAVVIFPLKVWFSR